LCGKSWGDTRERDGDYRQINHRQRDFPGNHPRYLDRFQPLPIFSRISKNKLYLHLPPGCNQLLNEAPVINNAIRKKHSPVLSGVSKDKLARFQLLYSGINLDRSARKQPGVGEENCREEIPEIKMVQPAESGMQD
jgi:hypothetical protein